MDMMKHEFENLAGYEVTDRDYFEIIEPMYMATTLTKTEFVKVIDKKRFALKTKRQLIDRVKRIAKHLKETCTHYTDFQAKEELEKYIEELATRFGYGKCYIEEEEIWTCYYPKRLVLNGERISLI